MKKFLVLLLVFCMTMPMAAFAEEGITVQINGTAVDFEDQQPVVMDGRTLVPFRAIAESLGGIVEWDDEYKVVYIACGKVGNVRIIGMQIGNPEIQIIDYINSESGVVTEQQIVTTDVPATIVNERTLVPLRVISDIYGGETSWDNESHTASITLDVSQNVYPTDEECVKFIDNNLFKAKHILISAGETRSMEEAKTMADEIMAEINAGADFDELMFEKSEDPGSEAYPEGYIFTFGEMVPEFENAVSALNFGEITAEPVQSSYGYHIIKRENFVEAEYNAFVDQVRFYVLSELAGLDVN